MRVLIAAVFAVGLASAAMPAIAADDANKKVCERLVAVLELAVQQRVNDDLTNRVRVALAAHERLGCDPAGLLGVLRITRPNQKD